VTRKSVNMPYSEYGFSYDFQVIVQSVTGLRPSVPMGTPKVCERNYYERTNVVVVFFVVLLTHCW
jgi:hypothetical protein